MNYLSNWDPTFFSSDEQQQRLADAPSVASRCFYFNRDEMICKVLSDKNTVNYNVYTNRCSCPDFRNRKGPCKHMHYLNMRLNGMNISPLPEQYIVVDTETTGFNSAFDQIIELGAVKVINGTPVERFQSYVYLGKPLTPKIKELTGITDDQLEAAPPENEVIKRFDEFAGLLPLVGHNVTFDLRFIGAAYFRTFGKNITRMYFDTLNISREVLRGLPHHKLIDVATALNVHSEHFHGALVDANTTFEVFKKLYPQVDLNIFVKKFTYRTEEEKREPLSISAYTPPTPAERKFVKETAPKNNTKNKLDGVFKFIKKFPVVSSIIFMLISFFIIGFAPDDALALTVVLIFLSGTFFLIAIIVDIIRWKKK